MIREFLITFLANNLSFLANLATSVIINRSLGPTLAGTYYLLTVTYVLVVNVVNLGFNISNSTISSQDKTKISSLHSNSLALSILIGLVTISGYFLFRDAINETLFKGIDENLILISLIFIPFSLYSTYWGAIMVGLHKISLVNKWGVATAAITALNSFIILVILDRSLNELMISGLILAIIFNIFMILIVSREQKLLTKPNLAVLKESFDLGFKGHLGNIAHYIFLRFDSYVINSFFGIREVGYYGLATSLAEKIWLIIQPLYTVVFSEITGQKREVAARLVAKMVRFVIILLSVGSFVIGLIAAPLIKLIYGEAFLPAVPALLALLPGVVFFAASWFMGLFIIGNLKRPLVTTVVAWAGLLISFPLYFSLIPLFGIIGAGVASSVTYSFIFIATLVWFIKLSNLPPREVLLIKGEDIKYVTDQSKKLVNKLAEKGQS